MPDSRAISCAAAKVSGIPSTPMTWRAPACAALRHACPVLQPKSITTASRSIGSDIKSKRFSVRSPFTPSSGIDW